MLLDHLEKKGLISPPSFVVSNCCYLVIMGSQAYGVANTAKSISDMDIYGFCIPPKDYIFHTGEIPGFGTPGPRFDQWQKHAVFDLDAHGGKGQEYDFSIFSIVKYFELCRENNPNMIDSLFVPINCIVHSTAVGQMVRDNRKLFLSKKAWKRFRGYAHQQLHKADSKEFGEEHYKAIQFEDDNQIPHSVCLADVEKELQQRQSVAELKSLSHQQLVSYRQVLQNGENKSKRFQMRKSHGCDTKFLYHVLRLCDEAEQILLTHDIDLQRAREPMKAIRRGEWKIEDVKEFFKEKEKALESAYVSCKLPEEPDEAALKDLLIKCLEEHYGNLNAVFQQPDWATTALRNVDELLNSIRQRLYGAK